MLAFLAALLINPVQQPPARAVVTGTVFIDANHDGVRQPNERGLAGVVVSNQDAVVVTDAAGGFRIPRGPNGIVFVSTPDGYRASGNFWRSLSDSDTHVDFPLMLSARARDFTFVHASDTHISPTSVDRTRRLRTLVDSISPAFLIVTGDLVRDALRVPEDVATSYYDLFARERAAFHTPVWTVPGNHENFGIERDQSHVSPTNPLYGRGMYHKYFGPDYYSFNFGGIHFIGLNTEDIEDQSYYGHVDSLQLAWLERDLALVPQSVPVITFDHIPFLSSIQALDGYTDEPPAPSLITVKGKTVYRHTVSNAGDVFALLRKRRHVLALGGHFHSSEKLVYEIDGVRTHFDLAAAIIGPTNTAGLRFPSGVTLYTVRDGVIDDGRFIPLGIPDAVTP